MYPFNEAKTSKRKPKIDHLEVKASHEKHAVFTHHYDDGSEDRTPHVKKTPDEVLEHLTKHLGIKWDEVESEEDRPNAKEFRA